MSDKPSDELQMFTNLVLRSICESLVSPELEDAVNANYSELSSVISSAIEKHYPDTREQALMAEIAELKAALQNIYKYWNGDANEMAMKDALMYIDRVCVTALELEHD